MRRLSALLGVLLLLAVGGCATPPAGRPAAISQRDLEQHAALRSTRSGSVGRGADSRDRSDPGDRRRRAHDARQRPDAADHQRARRHLSGPSRDGVVCALPRRHGLPGSEDPPSRRRAAVAQPLRIERGDRRHARVVLRARGGDADDDRPQPGRNPGGESAVRARRRVRRPHPGLESGDRIGRGPRHDRRSVYRQAAPGPRPARRLRVGRRCGWRRVASPQSVVDGRQAARDPGHGRGVHRLLARRRHDRLGLLQLGLGFQGERNGAGAQRPAARVLLPRHRRRDLAPRPRSGDARVAQRLPPRRGQRRAGRGRLDRQCAVGGGRLVQHQAALGARSPEGDPREARAGGEPRRRRVRRAISISLGCGDASRPLVFRNLEEVDCDVRGRPGVSAEEKP